jgi:hypothetical protein
MEYSREILTAIGVPALLLLTLWWLRRRGWAHGGLQARMRPSGPWLMKKLYGGGAHPVLQTIEQLPLSATHTLHLVRLADRAVLIATSAAGCQVVDNSGWDQIAAYNREAR